jgi:hypothetical protein
MATAATVATATVATATAATATAATATSSKIFIHEDHNFKTEKEQRVYYYNSNPPRELGTFEFNQKKWSAGINGWGDGECKFSKYTFNYECPYSKVYYYGVKETPGTTIGPEYEFDKHPKDRVYYRRLNAKGDVATLGRVLDHGYPYDAGFNGFSHGHTIFEFDKESFRNGDCRCALPVKYKVYFLE